MAVGGPNILIPGISDEAWEALKETAIESLSNLVQTELFPRLFEKSFFGGSAIGAVAGTAIRSLGTYLNNEDVSFTEALNQSSRFSLQTLSYMATGTSTAKLVNLLFRNKGLALATSRLFGRYSELVFREVGTNLLSNPIAQSLGHLIGLPSLPFSLKDGAYFAVSGSLGAIREAHIARGWKGIVAEGVHRIADTWVQNSMNGRITSGLDLIRATGSSFQKMMGGSIKALGLSQRPEHTNIPQPVVGAWNHPVTQTAKHMANRAITPLARLAAGASGLLSGTVYSPNLDLGELSQTTFNLMGSETKISIFGPNRTIYQTAVPVTELSKKGWLEHLSTQLKSHIKKNDPLELDVALNVENDTIKPYSIHLPPKEPEKERTHLRFSFSRNEKDEVVARFVDLKQGEARNGDQEQVIMHLAGNPALSEYPPRLQEARANYLLNGIVLGLQRKRGRWNYDGSIHSNFHRSWKEKKVENVFGADPCFQNLPPEGVEILYTGTYAGNGVMKRMGCWVENPAEHAPTDPRYFRIQFKLLPVPKIQNQDPGLKVSDAKYSGPGAKAVAHSMHLIANTGRIDGKLHRDVGKPATLQEALGLTRNALTYKEWSLFLSDPSHFAKAFSSMEAHLESRGDNLTQGVMITGQIKNGELVSLTCRPANQKPPKGGNIIILTAQRDGTTWKYVGVEGAHKPFMRTTLLMGKCRIDPDLTPYLIADTLTLKLRGQEALETAGYKLLPLEDAISLLRSDKLHRAWNEIIKNRIRFTITEGNKPIGFLVICTHRPQEYQVGIYAPHETPLGEHVNKIPLFSERDYLTCRPPFPKELPIEFKTALENMPSIGISTASALKDEPVPYSVFQTPSKQTIITQTLAKAIRPNGKVQKAKPEKPKPPQKKVEDATTPKATVPNSPRKALGRQPHKVESEKLDSPNTSKPSIKPSFADDHLNITTPPPPSPTALSDQEKLNARSEALASNLPPREQLGATRLLERLGNWRRGIDARRPTYEHASTSLGRIENFAGAQRLAHDLTNPGLGSSDRVAMIADRLPPLLERLFGPIKDHPDFSSEEPEIRDLFGKALEKPARFLIIFEDTERHLALATANQRTNEDAVSEALVRITGALERETQDIHIDTKIGKRKKSQV